MLHVTGEQLFDDVNDKIVDNTFHKSGIEKEEKVSCQLFLFN